MSVFRANCPYCGTKEVAFTILCEECLDNKGHWDTFAKCRLLRPWDCRDI